MSAIPNIRFIATPLRTGKMTLLFQLSNPNLRSTPVVAGQHHERVPGYPMTFQRG